jgi:hypothetical protein
MQHQIGLQNMSTRGALSLIAEIVEAVYYCRSSGLSSDFGCTNNSHSGKANEDVGAHAELGYPTSKCPNVKN